MFAESTAFHFTKYGDYDKAYEHWMEYFSELKLNDADNAKENSLQSFIEYFSQLKLNDSDKIDNKKRYVI